jgi:hypothetical protein
MDTVIHIAAILSSLAIVIPVEKLTLKRLLGTTKES